MTWWLIRKVVAISGEKNLQRYLICVSLGLETLEGLEKVWWGKPSEAGTQRDGHSRVLCSSSEHKCEETHKRFAYIGL